MEITLMDLNRYLTVRHRADVRIHHIHPLGDTETDKDALKQFGYGRPLLITYDVAGRQVEEVLHPIRRTQFGRERDDDRIAAVWLDFQTFNKLPRHVPAVDMLAARYDGSLLSLARAEELLLVTTYQPGTVYADDLLRIRDSGAACPDDFHRTRRLAAYLAAIHRTKHRDPALWRRRLRDLVGHGEGIMGLTDSYPPGLDVAPAALLRRLEEAANEWRWRLKLYPQRLSQVHGDFHPFNIVFNDDGDYFVLDRSRGEWGEPADDVSCLTINYIFFSLQRTGRMEPPFSELHQTFWEHYRELRPDPQLCQVIQPWLAWRALVLASPVWYPNIADSIRRQLLTFAERVMAEEEYDICRLDAYLGNGG